MKDGDTWDEATGEDWPNTGEVYKKVTCVNNDCDIYGSENVNWIIHESPANTAVTIIPSGNFQNPPYEKTWKVRVYAVDNNAEVKYFKDLSVSTTYEDITVSSFDSTAPKHW